MANLISKIYEIVDKDTDRVVCFAILQFSEHTDVKHWTRIADQVEKHLRRPENSTIKKSDLGLIVSEYVAQHFESGFSIIWWCEGDSDFVIRI